MSITEKLELFKTMLVEYRTSPSEDVKQKLIVMRNKILDTAPEKDMVEDRQGTLYMPVSVTESLLNNLFDPFGWSFEVVSTQIVANEYVITGRLEITCPITGTIIKRAGVSASQIRMSKGAIVTEIDKKIINALEMDAPHAKTDCLKNAASSLGILFGSNLNRKKGVSKAFDMNTKAVAKMPKKHVPQIQQANNAMESNDWLELLNNRVVTIGDGKDILDLMNVISGSAKENSLQLKDIQKEIINGAKNLTHEDLREFREVAKNHYSHLNAL